jgi:hypothetical protein
MSLCSSKVTLLQAEIEVLHSELVKEEAKMAKLKEEKRYSATIPTICSQLVARQAQLTELTTRRLIWLTWGLLALTAALLIFTIALYKEAQAQAQAQTYRQQTNQPHPPSASVSPSNAPASLSSPVTNITATNLQAPPARP